MFARYNMSMSTNMTSLTEKAQNQLDKIQLDIETSTQFFKPKSNNRYVIEIDIDKHEIEITEPDRFKDSRDKPLKQYQFVVKHVNNGVEQKWTVSSKRLVRQIMSEIRKGFKVMQIERIGEDRDTTYIVKGIQ
jgi:hypothetical protein